MIMNASLNFIHSIVINKNPKSIYNLFKNAENRRTIVAINTSYYPKSKVLKNFFMYKALKIYNNLPSSLRGLSQIKFKKTMQRSH